VKGIWEYGIWFVVKYVNQEPGLGGKKKKPIEYHILVISYSFKGIKLTHSIWNEKHSLRPVSSPMHYHLLIYITPFTHYHHLCATNLDTSATSPPNFKSLLSLIITKLSQSAPTTSMTFWPCTVISLLALFHHCSPKRQPYLHIWPLLPFTLFPFFPSLTKPEITSFLK